MIKKSKVAIFSDLHLGLYGNSEDWHDIAIRWAEWIAGDLKKRGIKDIFFLGDFFHNRTEVSVNTIHVASKILDILEEFNMIMIVGNHDAYYKNRSDVNSLALMKSHINITVVDDILESDDFGKDMVFVAWESEIPKGKKYDYVFGHFEIKNFKMNSAKVCENGLSASYFLDDITKRVFSGHFHIKSVKKYGDGEIRYVGNTFPHDFNDVGDDKGYYILDLENGDLEFVENSVSPKFFKVKLSKMKSFPKENYKGNIIKLIVDVSASDEQIDKISQFILKQKPFYFTSSYQTKESDIDVEDVESFNLKNMLDEFIEKMELGETKEKRIKLLMKNFYEKNSL